MSNETKFLIVTVVFTVGVLIGGAVYFTQSGNVQSGERVDMAKVLNSEMPRKGNPDAKVKIAEFSDFECPACAVQQPIIDQVVAQYKDSIYFEYHYFPLAMHKWSQVSAESAAAAGAQSKFFEYADVLFKKQAEWSPSENVIPLLTEYAKSVGLDVGAFSNDVSQNKYKDLIDASYARGVSLNVQATPTFFVNGVKIEGGMSVDDWKKLLDEELKK